jgi:23S rRNA pseudouridine2605 synthase
MIDQELQLARRERWHLDGKGVRTIEDARRFIESVGFATMYPQKPPLLMPTFLGAFAGSDEDIPVWQRAFSDPRAAEATELMVRLLRGRDAYEANLFDENNAFLLAASVFPYFYALVGERNPKQPPKAGTRSPYSQLACDAYAVIQREGPVSKQKLLEKLAGGLSMTALDKALAELWSKLRITRVDYNPAEGSYWDVLHRWAPEAVKEGVGLSVPEALSALLSKYLDCVIAAEQTELESFFGNFVPRSKVKDAIHALLAAREFSFVHVAGKSMLQITPAKLPLVANASRPVVR